MKYVEQFPCLAELQEIILKKDVIKLEYEAYNTMVFEQFKIIENEHKKWNIEKLLIVHRLGEVKVTESSVLIIISSRHRNDSLESVNYAINRLNEIVPIWKKEHYKDGSMEKIKILKNCLIYINGNIQIFVCNY